MDNQLYTKYKGNLLNEHLIDMFTDLLLVDEVNVKIFMYVGQKMLKAMDPSDDTKLGATVNGMVKDIKILRPVKGRAGTYEQVLTNIDRKRAERAVQSLLMTGLCYYEAVGKTKVIYCTDRGNQVLRHIHKKQQEKR